MKKIYGVQKNMCDQTGRSETQKDRKFRFEHFCNSFPAAEE